MERIVLKRNIIECISNDPLLFGKIAKALGVMPASLPQILRANPPRLTQVSTLRVLKEHLSLNEEELIENTAQEIAS